jgi:hypothetical protein
VIKPRTSYKQARQQQRTGTHKKQKGTNEHDKKEQKKKGTAISLETSINTRRWPNWAETCCVILKFKV